MMSKALWGKAATMLRATRALPNCCLKPEPKISELSGWHKPSFEIVPYFTPLLQKQDDPLLSPWLRPPSPPWKGRGATISSFHQMRPGPRLAKQVRWRSTWWEPGANKILQEYQEFDWTWRTHSYKRHWVTPCLFQTNCSSWRGQMEDCLEMWKLGDTLINTKNHQYDFWRVPIHSGSIWDGLFDLTSIALEAREPANFRRAANRFPFSCNGHDSIIRRTCHRLWCRHRHRHNVKSCRHETEKVHYNLEYP